MLQYMFNKKEEKEMLFGDGSAAAMEAANAAAQAVRTTGNFN